MQRRKILAIVTSWYSVFCLKMLKATFFQNDQIDIVVSSKKLAEQANAMSAFNKVILSPTYPKSPVKRLRKSSRTQYLDFFKNYFEQDKPDIVFFYNLTSEKHNLLSYMIRNSLPETQICILLEGFSQLRQKINIRTQLELAFKNFYCHRILRLNCYKHRKNISGLDKLDHKGRDLVSKIYMPADFPHSLSEDKVVYFRYPQSSAKESNKKKAIIISQNLIDIDYLSLEDAKHNSELLMEYLKEKGVEKVYLKSHPMKKKYDDFIHPDIQPIQINSDEFIDEHILKENYSYIITYYSTAIFSSAFNNNPNKKFISLGFRDIKKLAKKDIKNLKSLLCYIGVETLNLREYSSRKQQYKKSA